jgi:hypothetical protein
MKEQVLMVILKELQPHQIDELLSQVKGLHDEGDIQDALNKLYCYRVQVLKDDFNVILINSSTAERELSLPEYPTIREVIDRIRTSPAFLTKPLRSRMLSGITVDKYYREFMKTGNKPERFFLVDRDHYAGMNPQGLLYVRDGMHHLVAYGLATEMREDAFPIVGYYSTNKLPNGWIISSSSPH